MSDKQLKMKNKSRKNEMVYDTFLPLLLLGLCLFTADYAIAAEETAPSTTQKESEPDTIIVTGEKVKRTIYDTSASVEVFDAQRIESMPDATQVSDVLKMTTNMLDTGIGDDLPAIRGIDGAGPANGANAFLNGTRPRLDFSLDGRSLTYNQMAFSPQSLWDIDRVEVFRGSQSYIQGRNAIAGAIVMTSKDPSFDWESAVRAGGGNQSFTQTSAMISGPIIEDQLAFRLSADRQRRNSFVNLMSYQPVGDPREVQTTDIRGKLLLNPSGLRDLTTKLTVNYFDSRAPQNEALSPANHISRRFDPRRPVFETKSASGIWDIAWEPSEQLSVKNKLIYTYYKDHRLTVPDLPWANTSGREFQLEPLIRFATQNGHWHGLAGLRYFNTSEDQFVNLFGGSKFKDKTETYSAFAGLTWSVTPHVDITAASRVEQEHRRRKGGNGRKIDFDETWNVFLPKVDIAWKPLPQQTFGVKISRGYNAGGAGMTFAAPAINYTYDPEYVWSYELYSRHGLHDLHLELISNFFYNHYKDMQLPYYLTSALSSKAMMIRNADDVQTYGAELAAIWKPIASVELNSSVGLLGTKIRKFSGSGVDGHELPRAPAVTANLGAKYLLMTGLEVSGNVMFSDTYYSQYDNDPRGKIPSYWLANLQLSYMFTDGRVSVFAHNLFGSNHRIMVVDNDVSTAIIQRSPMVGATVQLNF